MRRSRTIVLAAALVFFLPACALAGLARQYDAAHCPNAGLGTIEFTLTPMKDSPSDYKHEMLFQASSSDGSEFYEAQVIGSDLLVLRDFGQCIRSVNRSSQEFRRGEPYRLMLTWDGPSTRLYINGREIKGFNMLVSNDSPLYVPFVKVGMTDGFTVNNVVITAHSQLSVDPADREAANNCHCPKLSQLLDDRAQEEYRGVALHHFSDQKALSLVKSYIALLPVPIAGYLKHIIFVEAADRLSGAQGLTTSPDTFYLKTGFEPDTFFHESTHISDMHNNWMQSKKWAQAFMGNDRLAKNTSILGTFDGSNAQEQIADFTGRVYGFYLKNRPSGSFTAAFGQDGRAKLDFLLNNGLVTGAVYDSLTRR